MLDSPVWGDRACALRFSGDGQAAAAGARLGLEFSTGRPKLTGVELRVPTLDGLAIGTGPRGDAVRHAADPPSPGRGRHPPGPRDPHWTSTA